MLPLNSYMEMIAKTSTVTRQRKQMLPIAGMIYMSICTSFYNSGNAVIVLSVRSALIALNAYMLVSP